MGIPDYQTLMLPLLQFASDGLDHGLSEAIERLANQFNLSDEEREEMLPSGSSKTFNNRVAWARSYLKQAGLIQNPRRGYFRITPRGREVLSANPERIGNDFLMQFQEFVEFKNRSGKTQKQSSRVDIDTTVTPEEYLESAYQNLKDELAQELLQRIRECSPGFFERLVVELLVKLGYGGSIRDAGRAIGKTGDGGIDGIIKEDQLGLDFIYIQAKRWQSNVGSQEIRNFVGALVGKRANKGVFITTSTFTNDAVTYIDSIQHNIVLIDGQKLTDLMIDHNVGVYGVATYEVKKVDSDYFFED